MRGVVFLCVVDCDGWVCCVEEIEVIGMCLECVWNAFGMCL